MLIYPAIDLLNGSCVRLKQGRFDDATIYETDPFAIVARFAQSRAPWVHMVDLDGAKAGAPCQHKLIERLAASQAIHIQAGGGVRWRLHVQALIDAGVARVVIGSAAVTRSEDVRQWITEFGSARVCLALDVQRDGAGWRIATNGWQNSSAFALDEALALYPPGSVRHVLITDIARDGMLTGPNVPLIRYLRALRPDLEVQASGGISALPDLTRLSDAGAAGAIVGRALYENAFSLQEALHAG